ncbi:sensor histidine kinase [Halopseudomonas salina]|nr:sensor histidine kinase [Halopseudomonas salina]
MRSISTATRLTAWVCVAFSIVLLVTMGVLLRQAEKDVVRELQSGRAMALSLLENMAQRRVSPAVEVLDDLRHVRIAKTGSVGHDIAQQTSGAVPGWLLRWMQPVIDKSFAPVSLDFADGQRWLVSPDPVDELEEVWESLLLLLGVFAVALVLSLVVIHLSLRRGLRAYRHLLEALELIGVGELQARLSPSSQTELNQLANRFNLMATALERAEASNQQLTRALMTLQEKERMHLAHALHDDLGQYLTGIRAQAYMLGESSGQPDLIRQHAQHLLEACNGLQRGFRALVKDLHPVVLDRLGLEQALRQLTGQWQQQQGIQCVLELDNPLPDMATEQRTHLYRLLQEALTNVARHAKASSVWVRLVLQGNVLQVSVRDNGDGLKDQNESCGVGMRSMRERARCLQSALQVTSSPGVGVLVSLTIPLKGLAA